MTNPTLTKIIFFKKKISLKITSKFSKNNLMINVSEFNKFFRFHFEKISHIRNEDRQSRGNFLHKEEK